jgi:hypothetical protein
MMIALWLAAAATLLAARGASGQPGQICPAALVDVDPRRSVFVTELNVVERFSLEAVLTQLAGPTPPPGSGARTLWEQWWDTQNPNPGLGLGLNCDDFVDASGNPAINGFPIECPRSEGAEINVNPFDPNQQSFYKPIALVNRFDLAPVDGANCGEYRIIFARKSGETSIFDRNLVIFEAVLSNPNPDCGLDGCRAIAKFWAKLTDIDRPRRRARRLERFYFSGIPAHDVEPVIQVSNFGPGAGQVRTNQFLNNVGPVQWQLREYKMVELCTAPTGPCRVQFIPVSVKTNPFGDLFDDTSPLPVAAPFQAHLLTQLPDLLVPNLLRFSYQVPGVFNAGQSNSQGPENNYVTHLNQGSGTFSANIQAELNNLGSGLSPLHIARRAMTQSCAGCHQLNNGAHSDLGDNLDWPSSLGFVHVHERDTVQINGTEHFDTSPALDDLFIPARERVLENFLRNPPCVPCALAATADDDSDPVAASAMAPPPPGSMIVVEPGEMGNPEVDPADVEELDTERGDWRLQQTLGGPRRLH